MRFSSLLAYAAAAQCAVLNHVEFSTHSGSFDVDRSSDIENTAAETVANAFGKTKMVLMPLTPPAQSTLKTTTTISLFSNSLAHSRPETHW